MMKIIEIGKLQSPYKQFDLIIPVNSNQRLNYSFATFEILRASSKEYDVSFGGSAYTECDERVIYRIQKNEDGTQGALEWIDIRNNSIYPLKITVVLTGGELQDNRIGGDVNVSNDVDNPLYVENVRGTILASAVVTIGEDGHGTFTPDENALEYVIQNQTGADIRLMASTGIILQNGASMTISNSGTLDMYGTAGGVCAVLETLIV